MFSLFEKKKIYFQFHYIDAFDKYKISSDYGLSSVWWQAIIKNKNNGLLSLASLGIDFEQWILMETFWFKKTHFSMPSAFYLDLTVWSLPIKVWANKRKHSIYISVLVSFIGWDLAKAQMCNGHIASYADV